MHQLSPKRVLFLRSSIDPAKPGVISGKIGQLNKSESSSRGGGGGGGDF